MPTYELNIRDYWQIIQKRKFVLVSIFLLVLIPSIVYTNMQKPVFRSVATVQWIERKTVGGLLTEMLTVRSGDPLSAQLRIATSLPILEKVVEELGLVRKDAAPDEITQKAKALQGSVSTDRISDTNIIRIIVNQSNPKAAAVIANRIAKVYIVENLKTKSEQSRSVREFIERQLVEVSKKLESSEELLARFKETEVPSGTGLPLENRLADLEIQRQNLLQQFTENHPDVKNIETQIKQTKEVLKTLPQKELEYNRLTREAELGAKLYRELKGKLAAARIAEAEQIADVGLVDSAVVPGAPVIPNKPLNYLLGIVMGLMLGLTGTFVFEQIDTSIGTIEDVETYVKLPTLGVVPYLRTKDEKNKNLIQRLWPKELRGKEKFLHMKSQLLIHFSSSSPVFEAYRILRTKIQGEVFKKEDIKGKVLLLTSSGPEEGKSITISNLAIVMAQGGVRTLLIDADLRRSVIHKVFGLKIKEPGLCDVLRGTVKPKDAIRTFVDIIIGESGFDEIIKMPGLDNLSILTSGSSSTTPAELLAAPEMTNLLESLKKDFDLILIDTPPVLAVTDAVILASKADGVILVYRVGKTARSILSRSKTHLVESGARVVGIILNNISPEMEMRYGYYYQYKYYGKYYTDGKEET